MSVVATETCRTYRDEHRDHRDSSFSASEPVVVHREVIAETWILHVRDDSVRDRGMALLVDCLRENISSPKLGRFPGLLDSCVVGRHRPWRRASLAVSGASNPPFVGDAVF